MHSYCRPALNKILAPIVAFALCSGATHAASDTDVWMTKVEEVVIADDSITIIGSAKIRTILYTEAGGLGYDGKMSRAGRPAIHFDSRTNRVTLVVRRQIPVAKPGAPPIPEERLEKERVLWAQNIALARELEAGKEIGRIGYYSPHLTVRDNMIESVSGFAYLYPKRAE